MLLQIVLLSKVSITNVTFELFVSFMNCLPKVSMTNITSELFQKPFKCDICNANFGQNVSLNTHVATVHEGKQEFKCDICNANFRQKGSLNTV